MSGEGCATLASSGPAFLVFVILVLSFSIAAGAAELQWTRVCDLPDPVGLKGMIAGVTGDRIVLAGGSNFLVPKSAGGKKTFHRTAWVQPLSAGGSGSWTPLGDVLPRAQAEGASLTTPHGVVSLGGDSGAGMLRDSFVLSWDSARSALEARPLPDLPLAVGSAATAWHEGRLYVAGGDEGHGGSLLFAALDLAAALHAPAETKWEILPTWPGPRRFGAALVPLEFEGRTELMLAGGKIGTPGPAMQRDYLDDVYAFNPETKVWRTLAPLPRRALLAVAFCSAPGRLVVAGGSDGHDIERIAELGERYRLPGDAMSFEAMSGRWSAMSAMPLGVAGAAVVPLRDYAHLVAGGEYSPALRTPQVFVVKCAGR